MVPSVMVGDSEGILTSVPGVEPPVGCETCAEVSAAAAAGAATALAPSGTVTDFQSSPSSANSAIRVPTYKCTRASFTGSSVTILRAYEY